MFEPVPMVRLSAFILERDERGELQTLGELGLIPLIHARVGPDTAPREPPHTGDETHSWAKVLDRLERLHGALGPTPGALARSQRASM